MSTVQNANGWSVQSSMPEGFVRQCCTEPKDDSAGFERLARSHDRTLVCRFVYDGQGYYYKEYFSMGLYKLMKDLFRGSWSRRMARVHCQLAKAGFVVAQVVAIGKKGWHRFAVTEEVSEREQIRQVFRGSNADERVSLMKQYGEMVGRLHRCGFSHGDLRWGNILVAQNGATYEFVLIDNERTKLYRHGIPLRLCIKNLVHTRFSGLAEEMATEEWNAFFDVYCRTFPRAKKHRWAVGMERKLKQRIVRGEKKVRRLEDETE